MSFVIHFIVKTPVKNLHFNIVAHDPVSAKLLPSLYASCALKASMETGQPWDAADIVIANIIPIPK